MCSNKIQNNFGELYVVPRSKHYVNPGELTMWSGEFTTAAVCVRLLNVRFKNNMIITSVFGAACPKTQLYFDQTRVDVYDVSMCIDLY